ncbi:MAG TPA: metallophosphoesterase [Pirellulales bacterium]|jgi:predicted phosphodiesterase|nr:metallophosphoesterase [Pirellulales bacterium]
MTKLRIIGDVHGQVEPDDVLGRQTRLSYSEIIAAAGFSVQIGDMGDADTYDWLTRHVDIGRHRFFPGNHDHYDRLPPHSLGDFGAISWGGVDFFFVRGAASTDRVNLLRLGERLGTKLWFEQEELTDEQMNAAEEEYLRTRPGIVLSHDAPLDVARFACQHAARFRVPDPEAVFQPSRTNVFLARLLDRHRPSLWVFGHHHHDFMYKDGGTQFLCLGELRYVDVDVAGNLHDLETF